MKNYGVKVSKKRTFGFFKFQHSKFLIQKSKLGIFNLINSNYEQQRYLQKTTCSITTA